jgi:hypothetical protein
MTCGASYRVAPLELGPHLARLIASLPERIPPSSFADPRLASLYVLGRFSFVEERQAILWSGLLLGSQTTDTLTTALDRARGTIELMPVSSRLLEVGGVALLWTFKVMVVASAAVALLVAARKVREDRLMSRLTFRFALVAVQAVTIGLAGVSLSNLALLSSISG